MDHPPPSDASISMVTAQPSQWSSVVLAQVPEAQGEGGSPCTLPNIPASLGQQTRAPQATRWEMPSR